MKKAHLQLFFVIVVFLYSCNSDSTNNNSTVKIKADSTIWKDSINQAFSQRLKSCKEVQVYQIGKVVKTILADNQDTHIIKGKVPASNCYIEIYSSDDRNGEFVIIDWDKELDSFTEFTVLQTLNNLTEDGVETSYICQDIRDINNNTYVLTKIQNKGETYFVFMFDFNNERQEYMQKHFLVPIKDNK